MAKAVLIEEVQVAVVAPRGLPAAAYDAMRQALDTAGFRRRLRRAARAVVQQAPPLRLARVRVTR